MKTIITNTEELKTKKPLVVTPEMYKQMKKEEAARQARLNRLIVEKRRRREDLQEDLRGEG